MNRLLVTILAFTAFLGALTQLAMSPLLAAVASDLDVSVALIGQAVTVTFLAGATLGLVVSPVADHFGPRRLLVVGALLAAFSLFTSAIAPTYPSFLLSRIPGGLGGAMMVGIAIVIASTWLPESQRRNGIAWIFTAFAAAPVIGFPMMTEIGDRVNWRGSMVVLGVLVVLSVPMIRLIVASDPARSARPFEMSDTLRAYVPILKDSTALMLQVCNFIRTVAAFGVVTYLGAYLMDQQGLTLTSVGYVYVFAGMGYFIGTRLGDGRYIPLSPRGLQSLSAVIFGVAYAAPFILSLGPVLTTIAITLGSIAMSAGFVSLIILITEESPGGPSTALMLRQSGFAFGTAAAGAIGGVVLAVSGFEAFGIVTLVAATLSAAAGQWSPGRAQSEPDPAPVALD